MTTVIQTYQIQYPGQELFLESTPEPCPLVPSGVMTLQRDDGIIFKRYSYCITKIDLDGSIKTFYNKPSLVLIISYKATGLTAIFAKDGSLTLKEADGLVEYWSGPVLAVEEEGDILPVSIKVKTTHSVVVLTFYDLCCLVSKSRY